MYESNNSTLFLERSKIQIFSLKKIHSEIKKNSEIFLISEKFREFFLHVNLNPYLSIKTLIIGIMLGTRWRQTQHESST